jgi:hypothetical protein
LRVEVAPENLALIKYVMDGVHQQT